MTQPISGSYSSSTSLSPSGLKCAHLLLKFVSVVQLELHLLPAVAAIEREWRNILAQPEQKMGESFVLIQMIQMRACNSAAS